MEDFSGMVDKGYGPLEDSIISPFSGCAEQILRAPKQWSQTIPDQQENSVVFSHHSF